MAYTKDLWNQDSGTFQNRGCYCVICCLGWKMDSGPGVTGMSAAGGSDKQHFSEAGRHKPDLKGTGE